MKRILVLSSSARKGGNSDSLADEFIRGAQESGHEMEKVMVDRTYGILEQLKGKTFYLITSGASPKAGPFYDHIREEFQLYLDCFECMKVGGVIIGENGTGRGVMSDADKAEAYNAGKNA